jgi:hypothetical protein
LKWLALEVDVDMPQRVPMFAQRKILELKEQVIKLRQKVFDLKQKMAAMKVEYEKKLEARKEVICDEERRKELIAQRERLLAKENARAHKGDFKEP